MTISSDKTNSKISLRDNWRKEGQFVADAVINAYMQGKNDGRKEFDKELKIKFFSNLQKALSVSESCL